MKWGAREWESGRSVCFGSQVGPRGRLLFTWAALSVALSVNSYAETAQAEIITFGYAGTVTGLIDPHGVLAGTVDTGTPVLGWFSFDTETPDSYPEDPGNGTYHATGQMQIEIGPIVALAPANSSTVSIGVAETGGSYQVRTPFAFEHDAALFGEFLLKLDDEDGGALSSDALQTTPPHIRDFEQTHFTIGYCPEAEEPGRCANLYGTIDSLTLIPEPSNAAMLLLAFCLGYGCRRRCPAPRSARPA